MARIWMNGFETGAVFAEPELNGAGSINPASATIETTIVRSGTYSQKCDVTSFTQSYSGTGSNLSARSWIRFYLYVTVLPTAGNARQICGAGGSNLNLTIVAPGTIAIRDGNTVRASLGGVTTGAWHLVEIDIGTSGGSNSELRFNGVSSGLVNMVTANFNVWFGTTDSVTGTATYYIDDISIDNADFCGPGKVVLLRPTSLNAAGGWVEGDGAGTAGMAAAVATRPPPGVASASETSATNIESPTNSATDNCDMNMDTYASAGITAADTINSVVGFVRHGEDITTTTKTGAVKVVSNPDSGTEQTFTYGQDIGAHSTDVSGGSDAWGSSKSLFVTSPAVTLTTAPVMRIGKRTATTRVVCCDFMGIYVDYTPGAGGVTRTFDPIPFIPRGRSL